MDWKNATISNNFMFRLVMEKQELCKPLLERILDIKIKKIAYLEPEKNFEAKLLSKGVRLDLYVEDEDGVAYDIEMQIDDKYKEYLGKRTRYYLSMMDNDALKKGELYHKLRKTYIIFICLFDPFDLGLPKYTFTARCEENTKLKLDDGLSRIFLNCEGDRHKTTKALANLLDYFKSGQVLDEYTAKIDKTVTNFREDNGKERLFMTYQQTIMEERLFAREEGREEGLKEGKLAIAISLLKEKLDLSFIMRVTELSADDIRKIAAQNGLSVVE